MSATLRAGGRTDVGVHPNRQLNEDYLLVDCELGLFAVFDAGGNWAEIGGRVGPVSAEAIQRVIREGKGGEPRDLIKRAFREAEAAHRAEHDEIGWTGACSVVLALFHSDRVFLSWLGDTVAHRVTSAGIELLTQPHTLWDELVRRGHTPTNPDHRKLLLHVLGNELPDPLEIVSFVPQPGDRLVLATDGVTDHITPDTILNACRVISDPTTCAEAIIEHAIMAGSRDNCSCAVIAFERPGDGTPPEPPSSAPSRKWWQFWK